MIQFYSEYESMIVGVEMRRASALRLMTSPVSAVSSCVANGHQTMTSRFRKPPCDPGRPDFPDPVLTLIYLQSPFPKLGSLSVDSHTPL